VAINIPGSLDLLDANELLGHIPAGQEPVLTLVERANLHYSIHAPPLVAVTPISAKAAAQTYRWPAPASADGLTYSGSFWIYVDSTGTVDLDVKECATYGGVYTAITGSTFTSASLTSGSTTRVDIDIPLAAATNYIEVKAYNGANNVQLQGALIRPKEITSISAGTKSSGFCAVDRAHLIGTGTAIHTEYFNRAKSNYRATMADRQQCVLSYSHRHDTTASYRFAVSGQQTVLPVLLGAAGLAGRSTTTVTVYCYATDSGSPDGKVRIGQVNGDSVEITADGTASDSETLTLTGDLPLIYAVAVEPGGNLEIKHIFLIWEPDDISASPLISSVAPPPRREYLAALDGLGLGAITDPYALTSVHFNPSLAGGTYWHWGHMIAPGAEALRAAVTRSCDGDQDSKPVDAELWTSSSGSGADDRITIPASVSGNSDVYPPSALATVDEGAWTWDAVPPVGAGGINRLVELTQSRDPQVEEVYGRYFCGFSGRVLQVSDLADLP